MKNLKSKANRWLRHLFGLDKLDKIDSLIKQAEKREKEISAIVWEYRRQADRLDSGPRVAIFCSSDREFRDLGLHPQRLFHRVTNERDLRGIDWSGAIVTGSIYGASADIIRAFEALRHYRPELFKNQK